MTIYTVWFRLLLGVACLHTLDSGCQAQVLQEGYCGKDAVVACVRDLGVRWEATPETDILKATPFATFGEVRDAFRAIAR